MSGIIKSGNLADLSAVRPFGAQVPPASVVMLARQDEERERLRRAVAALEGELRDRDIAIDVLRKDVERAFEDGKAKGHAAGLTQAQDREADRLAAVEAAARAASAHVAGSLVSLERLAAQLARECVDKILGEAPDRAALIGGIVAVQVARIDKAALLRIEVSRKDFPDDTALARLGEKLAPLTVAIVADTAMPSGGCVMVLRLGRVSVGIDQQWGVLGALLGEMAMPEAAP